MPEVAEKLSIDTLRYVADNLILELRDDRLWSRRILPDYHPEQTHTKVAAWRTLGAGRETKPKGVIDVLEVKLNAMPQLGLPPLMVALDEWTYDMFREVLKSERRFEHLDSLLEMNPAKRVFVTQGKGYGTAQKTIMRRAPGITPEEAQVALELARVAQVWVLPDIAVADDGGEVQEKLDELTKV